MYRNINIEIIAFSLTYMKNPVILQQVNVYNILKHLVCSSPDFLQDTFCTNQVIQHFQEKLS